MKLVPGAKKVEDHWTRGILACSTIPAQALSPFKVSCGEAQDLTCQHLCPLKDVAALGCARHRHLVGHILVPIKGDDLLGSNFILLSSLGSVGTPPCLLRDVVIYRDLDGGRRRDQHSVRFVGRGSKAWGRDIQLGRGMVLPLAGQTAWSQAEVSNHPLNNHAVKSLPSTFSYVC